MDKIHLEQVETVYRLAPRAIISSSLVALILSFVFWELIEPKIMLGWLTAYVAIALCRIVMIVCYFKGAERSRYAEWFFCAGSLAASLSWSAIIYMFDSDWGAQYQVLMFLAAWGVIANTGLYSALFSAMISYCLPILLTSILVLITQDDVVYHFSAVIVVVLGSGLIFQGYRLSKMTADVVEAQQNAISAYKKLEALSEVDTLTQLKNRGAMESFINEAWERGRLSAFPVSVIMIDVDYFKAYNDCYGHVAGDACLVQIAGIISCDIPSETNFVGRYGGEEFIIVLPRISLDEAHAMASKVQKNVFQANIAHNTSLVAGRVTISAGIASTVPTSTSKEEWLHLIDKADASLYTAKKKGRNCIVA